MAEHDLDDACRVCHVAPATTTTVFLVDHNDARVEHRTCDEHTAALREEMVAAGWRVEDSAEKIAVSTTLTVEQFGALDRLADDPGISRAAALRLLVERHRIAKVDEHVGLAQQAVEHPRNHASPPDNGVQL